MYIPGSYSTFEAFSVSFPMFFAVLAIAAYGYAVYVDTKNSVK